MEKRAVAGLLGLLGVLLIGFDMRWIAGDAGVPVLAGRWFGFEWARLDAAAAQVWAERMTPPHWGGVLQGLIGVALGVGLGGALLRRLQPERALGSGTRLALGLAGLMAVSPWTLAFVVTRSANSADAYLDLGDLARALGLGLLALGALGWRKSSSARAEAPSATSLPWLAVLVSMALPWFVSATFLGGEPLTNDGVSYRFQAQVFADGDVVREVAPHQDAFLARQVLPGPRAASKYPPGHAWVLTPGTWVGWPRLMPFLLLGLSTALVFALARRLGARDPTLAAWVFGLSPMVVGVESLWLSHGTSLPMGLVFAWAWLCACDRGRRAFAWALLAGLAIGLTFAARPITALALAVPTALVTLRHTSAKLIVAAFVGFLPVGLAFLWINQVTTGSPWKTAYGLYADLVSANDRYGFVNLSTAGPYTAYNLARLSAWLVGLGAAGWWLILGWRAGRPKRLALWIPVTLASFVGFYALHRFQGIPWVGPLYFVEAVPLLAVLISGGLAHVEARLNLARSVTLGALLLSSAVLLAPHLFAARAQQAERLAPYKLAAAELQTNARPLVVFVPQTNGAWQKLYPLPAPAWRKLENDGTAARIAPTQWPVFARDLGDAANQVLIQALGGPEVRYFNPLARTLSSTR
jgi:4-amino-4-deoxy-L-arabinose transferase-like glycosyltransferase